MDASDVENERLLGLHPESKRDLLDDEEANTPAWRKRLRRRVPAWLNWKAALFAIIILIVSAGLLANSFRIVKADSTKTIRPIESVTAQPVEEQPVTEQPQDPGAPDTNMHFTPNVCQGTEHHFEDQVMPLNFDRNRSVAFYQQKSERKGRFPVYVEGGVSIQRIIGGGSPELVLQIITNDPSLHLQVAADEETQAMKLTIPGEFDPSVRGQRPCLRVNAAIRVPENAEIDQLNVNVVDLDVYLEETLSLNVTGYTNLGSVAGNIRSFMKMPPPGETESEYEVIPGPPAFTFDSRRIEVNTMSGDISGVWPLYDLLGLHTASGQIGITIPPQEELPSDPKPAVLSLSTRSGDISASEPVLSELDKAQLPLRKYLVDIKSSSGEIKGAVAFSSGMLKTESGLVSFKLLPVIDQAKVSPAQPAQLKTLTLSAGTDVSVLEPVWFDGGARNSSSQPPPFNCFEATHETSSGHTKLSYPESWEGVLRTHSAVGKPTVAGANINVLSQVHRGAGFDMKYRKGPARRGSKIRLATMSGTAEVTIGKYNLT